MNILPGYADVSVLQLALVAGVALFASIVGGLSGYGAGALMPLVLVPLVGAEPVVPIIAISALFNNSSRLAVFRSYADFRRAGIVLAFSVPTCVLGAWGYTRLSNAGAALVIAEAAADLGEAVERAARSIDDGSAAAVLGRLVAESNAGAD